MKKLLLLFTLVGFSIFSYSQERKIKISVQHGYFNGGDYFNNVIGGTNTGMDISYFLSERFFLTTHFNHGENGYYENSWVTNYPDPLEVRYAVGFYIEPDFGFFTGVYHGPQLSVSF
jgi:hypothetical protein